jgi:hypothetical protein
VPEDKYRHTRAGDITFSEGVVKISLLILNIPTYVDGSLAPNVNIFLYTFVRIYCLVDFRMEW